MRDKRTSKLVEEWKAEIEPTVRGWFVNGHVVVRVGRWQRGLNGKRYVQTTEYLFGNEVDADRCIDWWKRRGGIVELFSYRVVRNVAHPLDPDISDVCPCG